MDRWSERLFEWKKLPIQEARECVKDRGECKRNVGGDIDKAGKICIILFGSV